MGNHFMLVMRQIVASREFTELAEQWRALAEQAEYLEQYHTR